MGTFRIEIADKQNSNYLFAAIQSTIRGRATPANVASKDKNEFQKAFWGLGDIPGQYIELDADKRIGRVIEPLADTDEGRELFKQICEVFERFPSQSGGKPSLEPTKEIKLSVDDVKTWAFEMAQCIETRKAVYVGNSERLPPQEEIRTTWAGARLRTGEMCFTPESRRCDVVDSPAAARAGGNGGGQRQPQGASAGR